LRSRLLDPLLFKQFIISTRFAKHELKVWSSTKFCFSVLMQSGLVLEIEIADLALTCRSICREQLRKQQLLVEEVLKKFYGWLWQTHCQKRKKSSHDARMIRHLGFRVCTCKIQHQLPMSTITTCILSMNLPWWNFWKKLSKASNTCRAAALGSSGMIITSRYQVLVYQRHTPQACGWKQRNYNERNEFSSRNPLVQN